jgi:hypothetical protein
MKKSLGFREALDNSIHCEKESNKQCFLYYHAAKFLLLAIIIEELGEVKALVYSMRFNYYKKRCA